MWGLIFWICAVLANPILFARDELAGKTGNSKDDFYVSSLPGLFSIEPENIPVMFAGQLELYPENGTHYFFWKFEDQKKAPVAENKLIFWLNGGPGCSSMDGALMEAGPLRVDKNGHVVYNEGSWHKKAPIVFVDQPAGTGFSYSNDYAQNLGDVSWHFVKFLERYFELFPEEKGYEIMLAGESYAGQYIPFIAHRLLETKPELNIRGLLIGNGYIDPYTQGLSFVPFAVQAGMIDQNHPNWKELLERHEECQKRTDKAKADKSPASADAATRICDNVLSLLLKFTANFGAASREQCYNMYDYTLKDSYPSCGMHWPPDLAHVTPFLRDEGVMKNLNLVNKVAWKECRGAVGSHLSSRDSLPSISLFPELLKKTNVVLFHGNRDIICNYIGAEYLIRDLEWNNKRGFSESTPKYDWVHDGTTSGYIQTEANLTYVNVFDASHMVPFDKPELSSAIVDLLYERYTVEDAEAEKSPQLVTQKFSWKIDESATTPGAPETSGIPSTASGNSTATEDGSGSRYGNAFVRLIQFIVIVVLIWGMCALFSAYRLKPASIIKTKASNKKKNVQWADQLEEEELGLGPTGGDAKGSLLARAFSKITGGDKQGRYSPTSQYEDIELENTRHEDDDFIIASDDEEASPVEAEEDETRSPDERTS